MNAPLVVHEALTDAGADIGICLRVEAPPEPAYVLGERLFKDALLRERRRAERLSSPFAVIVVDRSHLATDRSWEAVFREVADARRDVDLAGWLEQDAVLGLLLPEASVGLASEIARHLRRRNAGTSVRLYAHGAAGGASNLYHPPVDLLLESFASAPRHPASNAAKRVLDVVGSLALLALFAPVMLLAFLAIKLTSRGPALFRQVRVGQGGESFTMLKFRSMRVDAPSTIHQDYATWFITASGKQPRTGNETYKLTSDPRVTRVGNWLRKTSLDEVPQFWNVLRGDMSLVGPRPPLQFEVDRYQPWHRRRVLDVKPGITGIWQVNGRSRTTFDEMVRMDLEYARTRSFWTDIRILAATPLAMIKGAC